MFKITSERIPESQVLISIEIEPEQVTQALERAYRSISSRANVPGFRRGKAPRHMVERLYGKDAILHEGVELLASDAYRAALDQTEVIPIDQPKLEFEPDIHSIKPGDGLVIKATVPVRPEVVLGDYSTLRLEPIAVEVTPEQVNTLVSYYQQRLTEWRTVERPAKMGDHIVADVVGVVGVATKLYSPAGESLVSSGDGDKLYDLTATEYKLDPASRAFAPGFSEQVAEMKAGDSKGFELSLPADHSNPEMANRMVTFTVKVNEVKEEHVPALDDDFAKTAGFSGLEHMRENLRASILRRMEGEAREVYEERILTDLIALSKVEIPANLVDNEARRLVEMAREDAKGYTMSVQERMHIEQSTEEALLAEARDRATRNVTTALLLNEIAEREAISVTSEELDLATAQVAEMRSLYGERRTSITSREREVLEHRLHRRKTISRLIDMARERAAATAAETPSEATEPAAEATPASEVVEPPVEPEPAPTPQPEESTQ